MSKTISIPLKLKSNSIEVRENNNENLVDEIVLEPVGFPISVNGENLKISVDDEKLFNKYAVEQWVGEEVIENDYLFDNTLIPDYAFKIISVKPEKKGIIGQNTKFRILKSKNKTKLSIEKSSFNNVIGQEHAKKKCKIIVKYLQNPEIFGEWAPKNILFYGPPGTGKTLLARALSSETNVPLYLIKATELIGEHVGDGSRQIRKLYKKALSNKPCIIFIDEIDAIALNRQYQSLRGDVSEIVNALLTELDGIYNNDGIITIGATNNINMLDEAIKSRFEETIEFKVPNDNDRLEILKLYLGKVPLDTKNINIKKYVEKTKNMCGRDIKEKLIKPAVHNAILNDRDYISEKDLDEILAKLNNSNNSPSNLYY